MDVIIWTNEGICYRKIVHTIKILLQVWEKVITFLYIVYGGISQSSYDGIQWKVVDSLSIYTNELNGLLDGL